MKVNLLAVISVKLLKLSLKQAELFLLPASKEFIF